MTDFLPDFRQIRAFVGIINEGSFTIAAKKLGLTQSAISHSLRALEDQLDCRLVDRMGKKILPTNEGELFYKYAIQIMDLLTRSARECNDLKNIPQVRLRIGLPNSLAQYLIPDALREFRDSFPRCKINLHTGDTQVLLEQLSHNELDLVIGMQVGVMQGLWYKKLFVDELFFVVAPGNVWVSKEVITKEEVAEATLISYARSSPTHLMIENAFRSHNMEISQMIEVHDMQIIKEMARAGLGVGIMADWQAKSEWESGELHLISLASVLGEPLMRTWGIYVAEGKVPTLVEEVFIGVVSMLSQHMSYFSTLKKKISPIS